MDSGIIRDYLDRSGDAELPDGNLEENEHGFCIWRADEESIILIAVYGDGGHWNKWAEGKAKELKKNSIYFGTKRNPEPFCRKHGFKVIGYILARSI